MQTILPVRLFHTSPAVAGLVVLIRRFLTRSTRSYILADQREPMPDSQNVPWGPESAPMLLLRESRQTTLRQNLLRVLPTLLLMLLTATELPYVRSRLTLREEFYMWAVGDMALIALALRNAQLVRGNAQMLLQAVWPSN